MFMLGYLSLIPWVMRVLISHYVTSHLLTLAVEIVARSIVAKHAFVLCFVTQNCARILYK